MTPTPFVSIVVPTYNRRDLLGALLASIAALDWPADRLELLVVDNSSTDGTPEAVEAFARTVPFPVQYHRQSNRGPAKSRDFGLRTARGEIVAFTDSDCVVTPGWLRHLVAAMGPGVGCVQGRTLPNPAQPRHRFEKTIEITAVSPFYETCNIAYPRALAIRAGGFTDDYEYFGEDTDLGWRVHRTGARTVFAPEALVHHEVFRLSPRAWLREVRHVAVWPQLVARIPELREHLYLRVFLLRITACFDLAVLGVVAALAWHPAALAACVPYVVVRWREAGRFRRPWEKAARIVVGLPRAALICWWLLRGSVRHRTLVL